MKTDHLYRALRMAIAFLMGALVMACGEDNPGRQNPDPDPKPDESTPSELLKIYQEGRSYLKPGNDQDFKKAFDLFLESANKSCDSAQVAVAFLYEYGLGTTRDMEQAQKYYEQAARQGNMEAKEKLDYLQKSNSRIDFPSGFTIPAVNLLIWDKDTVRPVNGDFSFFCSDSDVFVTDESGNPLYFSFRAADTGVDVIEPIVLNATETAVSMLLSSIPWLSDCDDNAFIQSARASISTLPETLELANSIDLSVKKNGHLKAEDIAKVSRAVGDRFLARIGIGEQLNSHAVHSKRRTSPFSTSSFRPSTASSVKKASGQGRTDVPIIVYEGNVGDLVFAEFTKNEPEFNAAKNRSEWQMKVYNTLPIYLAMLPGRIEGNTIVMDSHTQKTEFVAKASNISDIYKDIGLKGPTDFLKNLKTFFSEDLGEVYRGVSYWIENRELPDDYHGLKSTMSSVKVSAPINDDYDVLLVTSVDTNHELLAFAIFDIVVFPIAKRCIKELKELDDSAVLELFGIFLEYFDTKTLNSLMVCIENQDKELFYDIVLDRTDELLKNGTDWLYDFVKKQYIKWGPVKDLKYAVEQAVTKGVVEIAVIKETLDCVELFGNFLLWVCKQFAFPSYAIGFEVQSNEPPALLEPVDLGLSVYWANCSVGATTPRGSGRYYAWGETTHKDDYKLTNYLWPAFGSAYSEAGPSYLGPKDDVATVLWGSKWRMPTSDEIQELIDDCLWESSIYFPVGYNVTSRTTGKSIFISAGGAAGEDGTSASRGEWGRYWSSSLTEGTPSYANMLSFHINGWGGSSYQVDRNYRFVGQPVRPVADIAKLVASDDSFDFGVVRTGSRSTHTLTLRNDGMGIMTVSFRPLDGPFKIDKSFQTSYAVGPDESMTVEIEFSPTYDSDEVNSTNLVLETNCKQIPLCVIPLIGCVDQTGTNLLEAVDLGVSVKWASRNVGASSPDDYGVYVAWGELDEDSAYIWDNYQHCNGSQNSITKYSSGDGKQQLDPEDDIAIKELGDSWRIPTESEFRELIEKCDWSERISLNGVNGCFVYNKTDHHKYIFLPMGGHIVNMEYRGRGETGLYWTSSLWKQDYRLAFSGNLESETKNVNGTPRAYGLNVRAVFVGSGSFGGDIEGTGDNPWN